MPRTDFLPFASPCIGDEEIEEVLDTFRSTWLTTGPKTRRFEQEFAAFIGVDDALALNSCTAGLHTALVALGIGSGAEVITTTLTFAATVNVIEHTGARPVLVDVEEDTLNIDPDKVAEAVTSKTRAVIPVHYSGHPADLDALFSIAEGRGIRIIEDAAHALPAAYKGRRIGSGENPAAFSFFTNKNMTTAEGGMLVGDVGFLEHARIISLHGMTRTTWMRYAERGSWFYEVVAPGFKYNMTDIQAAIGLAQLRKLESFQKRRHQIAAAYDAAFSCEPALQVPVVRLEVEHARHLYPLRIRPERLTIDRDRFIAELAERNIGSSVHFIPVHMHPYYRDKYGYKPGDYPRALENYKRLISLPLNPTLTDGDVDDVIEAVLQVVDKFKE